MGLFEGMFSNPETMGLLAAASGMLQAGGPSRTPVSLGQALGQGMGAGMQGYQAAQQAQADNALRAMKMRQLTLGAEKDEMEMKQLRDAMARQERIRQRLMNPAAAAVEPQASTMASFALGGAMSPKVGGPDWMQTHQAQQPTMQPRPQKNATRAFADNLIAKANIYAEEGDDATAIKMYEQASKFMPKVKNWQQINQNGKVMYAPYYEDGTAGEPVPYEVAEKLHFADNGQFTGIGVDQYTGKIVAPGVKKEMTPGERASNSVAWFNATKPQFSAEAGGFVNLPSRGNPMGSVTPVQGVATGGKPPAGYRWKEGGTNLEPIPGGPADKTAAASEGERKAATLLTRLEGSQRQLAAALDENPDAATPGVIANSLRAVGAEALANKVATSSERQRVEAAQLDMLDAALTLGTGAAYTREQLEGYRKAYFPQIGDTADTIKDKEARLANIIEAAKISAGRAATPNSPTPPINPGVKPFKSWKDAGYKSGAEAQADALKALRAGAPKEEVKRRLESMGLGADLLGE
jgi:hypothetical protein